MVTVLPTTIPTEELENNPTSLQLMLVSDTFNLAALPRQSFMDTLQAKPTTTG